MPSSGSQGGFSALIDDRVGERDPSAAFRGGRGGFRPVPAALTAALQFAILVCCGGCPSTEALPTQAPIREEVELRTQRDYLLYVPSTYSDKVRWPLVVACHGTWPYDTAELQMREWARFAEDRGIIVAAPRLISTKGDFPPPPEQQISAQREDERAILAMVAGLKRKYHIAEEQVFMTGWSAGGYVILHAGLRNPEVFRALAIRQGSFDPRFMDVPQEKICRWQRILVIYGMSDLLRDQSIAMIEWLRDRGCYVDEREIAGAHRRIDPSLAWKYFREVVKGTPWINLRVQPAAADDGRRVRFYVDAVPRVLRQKWFFGDGSESGEASPVHTYEAAGRYEVTVNVALENGKKYSRSRVIEVRPQPED